MPAPYAATSDETTEPRRTTEAQTARTNAGSGGRARCRRHRDIRWGRALPVPIVSPCCVRRLGDGQSMKLLMNVRSSARSMR